MTSKFGYLLNSVRDTLLRRNLHCPSCGGRESEVIDRKYFFTALRRCKQCSLQFRTPTTDAGEQSLYYQSEYRQGFTTQLPDDAALIRYLDSSFEGTEKDYRPYLRVLDALGVSKGARVFDFGCSWGYGSWQLGRHGYHVEAYEISEPRARFASSRLSVSVHLELCSAKGPYDVFFSAHVLEHVPSIKNALDFARSVIRPGGLFVAFTPNGSEAFRRRRPEAWSMLWGLVHPNLLDDRFYRVHFADSAMLAASSPYDLPRLASWAGDQTHSPERPLDGDELLFVARC